MLNVFFDRKTIAVAVAASVLGAVAAERHLTLGSPFTDHAVLQRDELVTVRGKALPGAEVDVSFAGNTVKGNAGADGKWCVKLPAMPASKTPRKLVARSGAETVAVRDILVGEVWFASGQSNMEMPLWHPVRKRFRDKMGGLMMQWSSNDNFRVCMTYAERGVAGAPRDEYPLQWTRPSAEWLASNKFSAVAYYFGRELESTLDVPVGVMAAYWGGTAIGYWVPDSGWQSVKDDPFVATNVLKRIAERPLVGKDGNPRRWPAYPGDIWNEMVAPFAPYTIKGMIWYQGCSDIDANHNGQIAYSKNMRALMNGWRREFGCPRMRLLFVELAQFTYPWMKLAPDDERLAELCDEQVKFAREEKDACLTCVSDIGDLNDIHPCRKLEVGIRLAALAFGHVYGLPVRSDPPRAVSAKLVAPGKVEVTIEHARGLYRWMPEVSLWTERQNESSPIRFIAADGTIADCESEIAGEKLVVTCGKVPYPKYVTHLRRRTDESNLYNDSTLPLGTFKLEVIK